MKKILITFMIMFAVLIVCKGVNPNDCTILRQIDDYPYIIVDHDCDGDMKKDRQCLFEWKGRQKEFDCIWCKEYE